MHPGRGAFFFWVRYTNALKCVVSINFVILRKIIDMETVHLKINAKVYDHVMWLLKQFNTKDVQIVSDNYLKAKEELDETLRLIDNNEMKFLSLEEFDNKAEEFLTSRNES